MQAKLTIGERMKDLRVEKGLTLEALGQQTGLSRSAHPHCNPQPIT